MTTITATEATRILATHPEIMVATIIAETPGFIVIKTGNKQQRFAPLKDKNQIFQCLETWRQKDGGSERRRADIALFGSNRDDSPWTSCELVENLDCAPVAYIENTNLNHAIALALIEAVTGVKYKEIKED